MVHFILPKQNKRWKCDLSVAQIDLCTNNKNKTKNGAQFLSKEKDHMQMNTIKILLNFGQNNKQVNTLPPC